MYELSQAAASRLRLRGRSALRASLVALVSGVVAVAFIPMLITRPSRGAIPATAKETAPSVTVEHEFITVAEDATAQGLRAEPPVETGVRHETNTSKRRATLMDKTRRALLGEGRHRPEPFPRVR